MIGRRHLSVGDLVHDLAGAFIVAEEEDVILPDWASQRSAELIPYQDRLLRFAGQGVGRRRKGSNRVEDRVADVVVGFAVELVGAAANADVDDGTGRPAILRAVVIGLDLELGDGVGRRRNRLV